MLKNHTASELADILDRVKTFDPQYTGPLSMIDEATLSWTMRYPELAHAQSEFSSARHQYRPHEGLHAWPAVVDTAAALAAALRPLADTRLTFCGQHWNDGHACTGVIQDDGLCRYALDHAPAATGPKG